MTACLRRTAASCGTPRRLRPFSQREASGHSARMSPRVNRRGRQKQPEGGIDVPSFYFFRNARWLREVAFESQTPAMRA
jgi:hypothetical protein